MLKTIILSKIFNLRVVKLIIIRFLILSFIKNYLNWKKSENPHFDYLKY